MKKIICLFLSGIIILTGCSTILNSNKSQTSNQSSWISNAGSLYSNLEKNEIVYRDNPAGLPNGINANLYTRLSWFMSLLDFFELHETLTYEKKESFFNALFGFIPSGTTDDFYREVAIGGYFEEKFPLLLYATVHKPSADAPEGAAGILGFYGNFVGVRNSQTGNIRFQRMNIINPNFNWGSIGVIFSNNNVVRGSFLFSQEAENKIKEEYKNNLYMQYVNLADGYLKDEIAGNDETALRMLNEAYANSNEVPVRIVAKLNTFLYYLSRDNIRSAEEALTTAARLSNDFVNIDLSFKKAVEIEAQTMLNIYKKYM
jgi:hypothetical protein